MAAPRHEMRTAFVHGSLKCWVYLEATMNDHLRHLVKQAPGVIRNQSGFISERVDSGEGLTLLEMQHASPPEVGKWVRVRRGIYKGDVGFVTSSTESGVQLLLIPRLSQPQASRGSLSHSCSAPTLFDCEAIKQLYNIEPVRIQESIYSFRGDRFEHGLVIKSYASDTISTTVSCMQLELIWRFLESCHPTVMAYRSSFLRPLEWHFSEGDEVHILDKPGKSGVISTLRSDSVELSTEEGIVCVPWFSIRKVIRQGDFVEVTGGLYQGWSGWVAELKEEQRWLGDTLISGQVANIVKIEDKEKPLSDCTQVFPIPIKSPACAHKCLRYSTCPSIF
jgi:transcription antitermination factor NusG